MDGDKSRVEPFELAAALSPVSRLICQELMRVTYVTAGVALISVKVALTLISHTTPHAPWAQ